MSRIRSIKPEFFKHEGIAELPFHERLAFIGLWTLADVAGRLEDRPRRIRAELFPYDADVDMEEILAHLEHAGFIRRYEVENRRLIQIDGFARHQRFTGKEAMLPSLYPGPPGEAPEKHPRSTQVLHSCPGTGNREQVIGNRDQGTGNIPGPKGPSSAKPSPTIPTRAFFDSWNTHCKTLPRVEELTKSRRKKISARIKQGVTLEKFQRAVEACTEKPFLRGDNDRGWTATFDWLIRNEENIEKAIGEYNGKPGGHNGKYDDVETLREDLLRERFAGTDESGDLPWGQDGPDDDQHLREEAGARE